MAVKFELSGSWNEIIFSNKTDIQVGLGIPLC